jgi:hypothetical protein
MMGPDHRWNFLSNNYNFTENSFIYQFFGTRTHLLTSPPSYGWLCCIRILAVAAALTLAAGCSSLRHDLTARYGAPSDTA